MGKDSKASDKPPALKYRQVKINGTRQNPTREALRSRSRNSSTAKTCRLVLPWEIPLAEVGGIGTGQTFAPPFIAPQPRMNLN